MRMKVGMIVGVFDGEVLEEADAMTRKKRSWSCANVSEDVDMRRRARRRRKMGVDVMMTIRSSI